MENLRYKRSYVIVRNDLDLAQKAVQGSHAVAEYWSRADAKPHESIIYVVVRDLKKLNKTAARLNESGIAYEIYNEIRWDENTAICTEPLNEQEGSWLRKYQLLK